MRVIFFEFSLGHMRVDLSFFDEIILKFIKVINFRILNNFKEFYHRCAKSLLMLDSYISWILRGCSCGVSNRGFVVILLDTQDILYVRLFVMKINSEIILLLREKNVTSSQHFICLCYSVITYRLMYFYLMNIQ